MSSCAFQVCGLGLYNTTSNEDIRHRWNGNRRHEKAVAMFSKKAGCFGRIAQLVYGDVAQLHGPSKLRVYANLLTKDPLLEKGDQLCNEAVLREYGIELPERDAHHCDDEDLVGLFL